MKNITSLTTIYSLLLSFIITPIAFSKSEKSNKNSYNIKELVFPSEVKGLPKSTGAIFYSTSVKDKVLIPIHFWGEISKSGLHFLPVDTNLIQGLSMAGGPRSSADLEELTITRNIDNKLVVTTYNLEEGGDVHAHKFKLRPGDTIFVKKSNFDTDRAYYTSLISVVATFLSTILIYREVKR